MTDTPQPRSKDAERSARMRQRRREGTIYLSLTVDPDDVARLADLGWVNPADVKNRAAVDNGFLEFASHALYACNIPNPSRVS
jgi:hypothetical protein